MSLVWVAPRAVAPARVRRLPCEEREVVVPVQHVDVPLVPVARAVPRQPGADRLGALQRENAQLRAELAQLRTA